MTSMKAMRILEWGKPLQLTEVAVPVPADDEALVRVHAASINPLDAAIAAGYLSFMTSVPMTLGVDYSGEVVATGKDVTHVKPGDEVFGMLPFRSGTFSEYATPKVHEVARKPASIDHIHASAIPLPAMAAWQSLFEHGSFRDGERVLIHGVAGALGSVATQLAKNRGAYVYGTDIPQKRPHMASIPVDHFIDHAAERFEDLVQDVDVVLDYVGGEYAERSYKVLKTGGRYVTTLGLDTPQDEPQRRGFKSIGFGAVPKADLLGEVAKLVDEGKLKTFVNRTFPLAEAQAAMEYRFTTKDPGKIVLTLV
jgi:NADPH:quinone reductase-like Zn-dependent oxidoreductase